MAQLLYSQSLSSWCERHAEDHIIFNLVIHWSHTDVFSVWATCNYTTVSCWYAFEFNLGHVTKNQPITVLILLSESLGIIILNFMTYTCNNTCILLIMVSWQKSNFPFKQKQKINNNSHNNHRVSALKGLLVLLLHLLPWRHLLMD